VTADATPDELRALPAGLAGHVTDGVLMLPSADVTADLALLTGWARDNSVDLTGLEVGPPSLEDAYLALTSEKGALNHG
jgi:ABC-2 type transport system ATP-binding protein